ncbi:hypothetical protein PBRA_006300 [Plasmodiophora brassicae]|uniref:DNA polymerase n=1 Tax=Plasmodiophora brassicae TaxID=37360 RepID=A0A0G4ISW3_PLABS|nr:hypothetical protein PBRA_006300 [Plasmodiophora brassicae]
MTKDGNRRASALVAIANAKKTGKRQLDQLQLNDDLVYESVSEDEYDRVVSSRRRGNCDSFIVDDGHGYVDNGEDDWEQEDPDDKEVTNVNARAHKRSRKTDAPAKPLASAFLPQAPPKPDQLKPVSTAALLAQTEMAHQSLLDDLLENPDDNDDGQPCQPDTIDTQELALFGQAHQIEKVHQAAAMERVGRAQATKASKPISQEERPASRHPNSHDVLPPAVALPETVPTQVLSTANADSSGNGDATLDANNDASVSLPPSHEEDGVVTRKAEPAVPIAPPPPVVTSALPTVTSTWMQSGAQAPANQATNTGPPASVNVSNLLDDSGSLELYWLDAYEDPQLPGCRVYLFGKTALKSEPNRFVSCCITVENIDRNVYVVPRSHVLADANDENSVTDQEVEPKMVWEEFGEIARKHGISRWATNFVRRKYNFDNPDGKVPLEADVMKVVYSAALPDLPRDLRGTTFSHVFGTKTSTLELFLLKRDLMGPQWLRITNVTESSASLTWCKAEFTTSSPKNVTKIEDRPPPSVSVLSLNITCVFNSDTHVNEIVAVTGLFHNDVAVDSPTDQTDPTEAFSIVRPLSGGSWPPDLIATIAHNKLPITCSPSERALLSLMLARLHALDPDVIVGHGLFGATLDIVLSRIGFHHIGQWSKLGRLRRSRQPRTKAANDGMSSIVAVSGGRLFCDTSQFAKEVLSKETSYDLGHLSEVVLGIRRDDICVEKMMLSTSDIIEVVRHCGNDAYLALRLMFHLQVLPLSKQLTCLGGHTWARSLQSARAQRIEFLLLHEFHRNKYIVPEKFTRKERQERDQSECPPSEATNSKRRKPAYSGGLVLEPVKGFYDKYVLMLDFNSLYPSIIQEFNICFTTIQHWQLDENGMASLPVPSAPEGILPRVIRRLVDRRRSVKTMLKNEKNPVKRQEYDIRQQALKLVANSMYGCLGFVYSRFYCKPLAALVTSQGRHILSSTVELIESMGHKVIYGDTDSVCVSTQSTDWKQVMHLGNDIKGSVNKLYKTLEIEIDYVFKALLLLQKKKYAALVATERDGEIICKREVRGLEMVRRDWCPLSKRTSEFVIDNILSGSSRDECVDAIHSYLSRLAEAARTNTIPLNDFVITKGLSKPPSDYPDAKSQPHVCVALQMSQQGLPVRVGDHIPYVICKSSSDKSVAQRAYHPSLVLDVSQQLSIDVEWYFAQQVLPPIVRLCAYLEGTDAAHLADCLGLDKSKFASAVVQPVGSNQELFESSVCFRHFDDDEAFKETVKLEIACPSCRTRWEFKGVVDLASGQCGLRCPSSTCGRTLEDDQSIAMIIKQAWLLFARQVAVYNEGWSVCEDVSCRNRERYAVQCSACKSPSTIIYKSGDLSLQVRYLKSLFDIARFRKRLESHNAERKRRSEEPCNIQPPAKHCAVLDRVRTFIDRKMVDASAYFSLDADDAFAMFRRSKSSSA